MPALGLGVIVPCLGSRALDPQTVRGRVDGSALAVTPHDLLLPVCGLVASGRGLRTATRVNECARALDDCARYLLAVARPRVTASGHTGPATVADLMTAPLLSTRCLGRGVGGLDGVTGIAQRLLLLPVFAATLGLRWLLPLRLRVAPLLFPHPLSWTSSGWCSACLGLWNSGVQFWGLFCRLLLSLVRGVCLPLLRQCQQQPLLLAHFGARSRWVDSAGAASATALPGRCEHAQESSRPERCHGRSSGRERSLQGGKHGRGRSPSPARSSRSTSASACSSSSESSVSEGGASALPPPPASHLGVGSGRSGSACSAFGRACSPLPGPSGLSAGVRAVPHAERSRSGLHYAVSLHPLLRGRRKKTAIVSLVPSIWTGMTGLGLPFPSSHSSMAWRNRQV